MDWSKCVYQAENNAWIATINCLPTLFTNVLNAALGFVGVVAVIMIIFSGIKWIASTGDAKQAEGAQKTLNFAVFGLIFVLIAGIIINVIAGITGVQCITPLGFAHFGFSACK